MKILITARNGQVGWELQRALAPLGEVIATDRAELNLADAISIRDRVREVRPQIIVNAGAYTAVDRAETEADLAMAINADAPGILAEEAKKLNALLIHYSTDYVFDGAKSGPYSEDDIPNPQNRYGATKLAGERAIQAVGAAHVILRTSWVYGARGHNFMLTMLRLARERDELRVVDDQIGAPTWCRSVAQATARILEARLEKGATRPEPAFDGLFHMTASGSTSWFGFAGAILTQAHSANARPMKLTPIATEQYPTPAKRPKNSLLACEKLRRTYGLTLEPWQADLPAALAEYEGGTPNS
jgi:dTDP-4-dehydrorhamnose reductase